MPPPHFIVIGAQKSASSFLQLCLTAHPDIWMPKGETPFFESPDYERQTLADLRAVFAGRAEKCLGIKRPNYIGKPEVPARIAADCPDARLIAVLRNPVDRAMSAWFHLVKSGFLPPMPFEQGFHALLDDPAIIQKHPRAAEVLEFGLYHKHLRGYEPFRKANRLLIMLHDDVITQPRECLKRAYAFLRVDDTFEPGDALDQRPQAVVYDTQRLRLLAWRPRLLYRFSPDRLRSLGRTRNPVRIAAAACVVALDRYALGPMLGNSKPKLSPGLRKRLLDFYQSDIESLETYLGRPLATWKQ